MKFRILALALSTGLAIAGCGSPEEAAKPDTASSDRPQVTVDLSGFPEAARQRANRLIEAVNAAPNDAQSAAMAGMFAHAYERPQMAAQYYARASELAPDQIAWPYLRGVVLMDVGRDAEALAAFEQAASTGTVYPPMQVRQARLMIKAGETDQARALLAQVTENAAGYAEARYHLGKLALDEGELDTAIEQLSRAVQITPYYGAAHYSLAAAYEANGQAELANTHRALFQQNQRGAPPNGDRLLTRVEDMRASPQQAIIRAGRLSAAGKLAEAAAIFENLLTVEPDNMVAHTNLIGLYGQLGQIDKAKEQYAAGVAIAPEVAALQSNYGVLMLRENDNDAAIDAFGKAIAADENAGSAYRYRGMAYQRQGNIDAAFEDFQTAFEKDPLDYQAGYLLGGVFTGKGDYAKAVETYERILEPVSQRTPGYLRALAQVHYNTRDFERAGQALERARAIAVNFGQTDTVSDIDAELAQLAEAGVETP
jgi:tetratricopeptide (TPR) repeat protein